MSDNPQATTDQLERYCLGLLPINEVREVERMAYEQPSVQDELDQIAQALADYALTNAVAPSPNLRDRVLAALSELGNGYGEGPAFTIKSLPRINDFSNAEQWQRTVAAIQPPDGYRNLYAHVLRQDAEVEQCLLWVREFIRPEEHHNEQESFLILEGRCECSIGGEFVQLGPGDYLSVPLDLEHTVRVVSPTPIKAILQRVKLAA